MTPDIYSQNRQARVCFIYAEQQYQCQVHFIGNEWTIEKRTPSKDEALQWLTDRFGSQQTDDTPASPTS